MIILLVVAWMLAASGLLWFGYSRLNGPALPPCSGRAPQFKPTDQLGDRMVGVAVRNGYQYREHSFAEALTRPPGIVEYYEPFPSPAGFQSNVACFFAKKHILSLIQLDPANTVSLAAIAHGKYDGYLRAYARAVKWFHAPVALSFAHEMNGWWYPWGLHGNSSPALFKTKPARFVAAWRHIYDVFAKSGAENVTWVWTVRHEVGRYKHRSFPSIESWWPGGKYVDWVGMDGYFRRPKETFKSVFGSQVRDIQGFTKKPILIAETAVGMNHSNDTKQIAALFTGVQTTPNLVGFVWFDLNAKKTGIHWNIDHNKVALTAIHKAIQAPATPAP